MTGSKKAAIFGIARVWVIIFGCSGVGVVSAVGSW